MTEYKKITKDQLIPMVNVAPVEVIFYINEMEFTGCTKIFLSPKSKIIEFEHGGYIITDAIISTPFSSCKGDIHVAHLVGRWVFEDQPRTVYELHNE